MAKTAASRAIPPLRLLLLRYIVVYRLNRLYATPPFQWNVHPLLQSSFLIAPSLFPDIYYILYYITRCAVGSLFSRTCHVEGDLIPQLLYLLMYSIPLEL